MYFVNARSFAINAEFIQIYNFINENREIKKRHSYSKLKWTNEQFFTILKIQDNLESACLRVLKWLIALGTQIYYTINFHQNVSYSHILITVNIIKYLFSASRKPIETHRRDAEQKRPNLNHTEYAYREAVNRLKSMLADSYSACRSNNRRYGLESDDADNVSVRTGVFCFKSGQINLAISVTIHEHSLHKTSNHAMFSSSSCAFIRTHSNTD